MTMTATEDSRQNQDLRKRQAKRAAKQLKTCTATRFTRRLAKKAGKP
jgi:hypothetical protein